MTHARKELTAAMRVIVRVHGTLMAGPKSTAPATRAWQMQLAMS